MTSVVSMPDGDEPREVWVSGNEIVRYVQHLIDGVPDNRATGRSNRLACKYAEFAMSFPNCKVLVKDHHRSIEADRSLLIKVSNILDALGIDYELGELNSVERDPGSFTGTSPSRRVVFIKATPKLVEPPW